MRISSQDLTIINNFFEAFAANTSKFLMHHLDTDIYESINLNVISSYNIDDAESFKENNILYKLNYVKEIQEGTLGVLVPEELLSSITDTIMGGKGDKEYKGSLSELEINSATDLFNKLFKETEVFFKEKYNKSLAFDAYPKMYVKELKDYSAAFDSKVFDFLVNINLTTNAKDSYEIKLLFNSKSIHKILMDLKLLQDESETRNTDIETIDINKLSDVKIEITAELGKTRVPIKYALELVSGSIVKLDTLNNSDIKVFANGIEVAMAEVVAIEDNFGLKITKIISPEERMKYV